MAQGKAPAKKASPRKRAARTPEPTPEPERVAPAVTDAAVQPMVEHCGYIGSTTDPEPDDVYTLSGVLGL